MRMKLMLENGDVFEGETCLDLVCAMRRASMFGEAGSVLDYIAQVVERARDMEGVELCVTGEEIDQRCESLVRELERTKLAVVEDAARKGLCPLAELVLLCADRLYAGDLKRAWPFLRERMRLTRSEIRQIERELGLAPAKP